MLRNWYQHVNWEALFGKASVAAKLQANAMMTVLTNFILTMKDWILIDWAETFYTPQIRHFCLMYTYVNKWSVLVSVKIFSSKWLIINSTQYAFKAVSPNQFQKNNAYLLFFILGSVNIERQKHILLGIS